MCTQVDTRHDYVVCVYVFQYKNWHWCGLIDVEFRIIQISRSTGIRLKSDFYAISQMSIKLLLGNLVEFII